MLTHATYLLTYLVQVSKYLVPDTYASDNRWHRGTRPFVCLVGNFVSGYSGREPAQEVEPGGPLDQ